MHDEDSGREIVLRCQAREIGRDPIDVGCIEGADAAGGSLIRSDHPFWVNRQSDIGLEQKALERHGFCEHDVGSARLDVEDQPAVGGSHGVEVSAKISPLRLVSGRGRRFRDLR